MNSVSGPTGWSEPIRARSSTSRWLLDFIMFLVLTFISAMAVFHSKGEAAIVTFVATSYCLLLLLFFCIWLYKRAPPDSPQSYKDRLKACAWLLTMLLTFSFGYMVMGIAGLTLPIALLVWVIPAATGIGAFFAFFELQDSINQATNHTMLLDIV